MPLGPAQVHPQQHRRPIGRLGAAGAGADRQDGRPGVVLTGEQELGPLARKVPVQVVDAPVDLRLELGIPRFLGELEGRVEVVGAGEQRRPFFDLAAQAVGLAQDVLRGTAVLPERRLGGGRLELGQSRLLAG
jgi:hypothetical protein